MYCCRHFSHESTSFVCFFFTKVNDNLINHKSTHNNDYRYVKQNNHSLSRTHGSLYKREMLQYKHQENVARKKIVLTIVGRSNEQGK